MMVPLVQTAVTTRGGATTLLSPNGWVQRVFPVALEALRSRIDAGFTGSDAEEELRLVACCAVAYLAHSCQWGAEEFNFNLGLLGCGQSSDCAQFRNVQRAAFPNLAAGVSRWVASVEQNSEPWERLSRGSLSFWPRLVAIEGLPSVPFSTALAANNRVAAIVGAESISGDEATFQREDWDGREEPAEGSNASATPTPTARTPRSGYAYSATLRRDIPNGHCVQSRRDRLWYRAVGGQWILTEESDPACAERHPLSGGSGGGSGGGGGGGSNTSSSLSSAGPFLLLGLGWGLWRLLRK